MKRKKILPLAILASLTVLTLVYGIAQNNKLKIPENKNPQPTEINNNDTQDSGTPTDDDPWKEMKKLVAAYYGKQGISYQGTMKLIDDNGDAEKVLEEKQFDCTLLSDNYHYTLGPMEVINKKNYIVAVDHENKSIALSPKTGKNNDKGGFFNIEEFKKLMADRKAFAKVTQLEKVKILTIDNIEDPSIQGYSIYYSPETYQIHKMLIGMVRLSPLEEEENYTDENTTGKNSDNQTNDSAENTGDEINGYYYYLEINFSNVKPLALKESDFNPENKFLIITKHKAELTTAYKDYGLISAMVVTKNSDK